MYLWWLKGGSTQLGGIQKSRESFVTLQLGLTKNKWEFVMRPRGKGILGNWICPHKAKEV